MDVEALEKATAPSAEVRLMGQVFTLNAPSLKDAARIQRELGRASKDAPEDGDERYDAFIKASVDAVALCLVDDVPRPLLERVIVRSGIGLSPLVREARVLCGMDPPGAEEDPDPDLPT